MINSAQTHIRSPDPANPLRLDAALLGLLMALSSVVFVEPAPYDLLAMLMFASMLAAGLRIPRAIHSAAILLGLFVAGNVIAAMAAADPLQTIRSLSIRIYMVLAWLFLLSLLLRDPLRLLRALWAGYLIAAAVAVVWGSLEYFGLIQSDLWQGGLRAKGPFKDPNVFGPFLVPATIYSISRVVRGASRSFVLFGPLTLLFAFGVLLSFSRGAWLNLLISTTLFAGLCFAFTPDIRARLQWLLTGLLAVGLFVGLITSAVSIEPIGDRFFQRAVLVQKYDTAAGGRFDSQAAAVRSISGNPLGVGPGRSDEEFGLEPHNLYLHVFVEGGWVAGLGFLAFIVLTGFRLLRVLARPSPLQIEIVLIFACLTGVLFQSLFIDSTHWRHLWLLLAIAWALVIACGRSQFSNENATLMSTAPNPQPQRVYARKSRRAVRPPFREPQRSAQDA